MKNVYVKDLKPDVNVSDEIFAVRNFKKSLTKDGKPYADLEISDKTGSIKGKIWSEGLENCDNLKEGDVIRVFGKVGSFNGKPQIIISAAISVSDFDLGDFIAESEHNLDEMKTELRKFMDNITDVHLKKLLNTVFTADFFDKYCEAPAAYTIHHAYKGGMADHTLDILYMAEAICRRYPNINKDLLFTGIILHDIGKLEEYSVGTTIQMTTEGKILGHVYQGAHFVQKNAPSDMPQDLLNEIVHMILSHQGTLEFGSPVVPKTPEAITLSKLDDASAKISTVYHFIQNSETDEFFTDYQRHFGTDFYKSPYHGNIEN